jgi:hypothetical protein
MSINSSHADIVTDAEQMIAATEANQGLLPSAERHRLSVAQTLAEIKALKTLQKTLTADKQKATEDLRVAVERLKEQMIFLRTSIRGDIGPRTEKLVEFGIRPLRRRGRRIPVEPPVEPELTTIHPQE